MRSFAVILLVCTHLPVWGQTELGLRFASNFNYFPNPELNDFAPEFFSTAVLGMYGASYNGSSRIEYGVNFIHKGTGNDWFPNLPLIMQDFDENQNVGLTALELHLKAGPSIKGMFHPKIGYVLGMRIRSEGFQSVDTFDVNDMYLALPFGFSFDLPTQFGSVGLGASYYLGISNVLKNPGPGNGNGRIRAFHFELTVAYGTKRRIRKRKGR